MIDDAIQKLVDLGIIVNDKVFIDGYSASGMFTSRFTILHPDRVQAAAFGGHGWTIVPTEAWNNVFLPYPYGTGDFQSLTGEKFNLSDFQKVKIFSYMGELDDNGWALPWYMGIGNNPGAYYPYFKSVFGSTAREMSESASEIYQALGCSAVFKIYQYQDHQSAATHSQDILDFFENSD
jgi:hypothetical protein